MAVSSLMDTWILLRNLEADGERNRTLFVLKSRGMSHSHRVREFTLSERGIELVDARAGGERGLTGSARRSAAAREQRESLALRADEERERRRTANRRRALEAQIAVLAAELEAEAATPEPADSEPPRPHPTEARPRVRRAHGARSSTRGEAAGRSGRRGAR